MAGEIITVAETIPTAIMPARFGKNIPAAILKTLRTVRRAKLADGISLGFENQALTNENRRVPEGSFALATLFDYKFTLIFQKN